MNRKLLVLAAALVLAGGAADSACAKPHHKHGHPGGYAYDHRHLNRAVYGNYHYDRSVVHDSDRDGIPNHYDNYDNRWDTARFRYSSQHVYTSVRTYSVPMYVEPVNYRYTRWSAGSMLPAAYYGNSYYVDYQPYGLPPPPYGYRWTRVGNDVYLVQTRDGLIMDVVQNLFRR